MTTLLDFLGTFVSETFLLLDILTTTIARFCLQLIGALFSYLYEGATTGDSAWQGACVVLLIVFAFAFIKFAAEFGLTVCLYVVVLAPLAIFLMKYVLFVGICAAFIWGIVRLSRKVWTTAKIYRQSRFVN